MDPGQLVIAVFIAVVIFMAILFLFRVQEQQEAWEKLAEQLGLQCEQRSIHGEYEGVNVRIFMRSREQFGFHSEVCVVNTEVLGELPRGFVAAPRRWTPAIERVLADNLLTVTDPALNECYLFQSDKPQEGQALIDDAAVQKALIALYGPQRVGYVEKRYVHVAYKRVLTDAEEARSALEAVVHAARTLAEVHARLAMSRERQSIT